MFLPFNINMSLTCLGLPRIASQLCSKNSVEVNENVNMEKIHNVFQNTQFRIAFEDLKINR